MQHNIFHSCREMFSKFLDWLNVPSLCSHSTCTGICFYHLEHFTEMICLYAHFHQQTMDSLNPRGMEDYSSQLLPLGSQQYPFHCTEFISRRTVSFRKQAQFLGASSRPGHPSVKYEETLSGSLVRLHDAAYFHEDIHHKICLGREVPTSPPK